MTCGFEQDVEVSAEAGILDTKKRHSMEKDVYIKAFFINLK